MQDIINLPNDDLKKELKQLNLTPVKIIFENPRKKRYVILVKNNTSDQLCVLKWSETSSMSENFSLEKEIEFYKNNEKSYLPELIYSNNNNKLLVEFVDSLTLREWIINYRSKCYKDELQKDFKNIIDSYCLVIKELSDTEILSGNYDSKIQEKMTQYCFKLLNSGPAGTSKTLVESAISRIIYLLSKKVVNWYSFKILEKFPFENNFYLVSKTHGDLHLNNLLVDKISQEIKIIDWENIETNSLLLDIAYNFVMLDCLLKGLPLHQKHLRESLEGYFENYNNKLKNSFFSVYDLYKIAISINSRFNYNISLFELIKENFKFPFRMLEYYIKLSNY